MNEIKTYQLNEKMLEKYDNIFNTNNNPRKTNFRIYNSFVQVKKAKGKKVFFQHIKGSDKILKIINHELEQKLIKILEKEKVFDNKKYNEYKIKMLKEGEILQKRIQVLNLNQKSLTKEEKQEKIALEAYFNDKTPGSNWTLKKNSEIDIDNKVGIIINQFDMAAKLINNEMRNISKIAILKNRYNDSIKNSGFDINKLRLEKFIKEQELTNSQTHNEIYVCFLAYIFTTKVIKNQLLNLKEPLQTANSSNIFTSYYAELKKCILGDKHEN